MLVTPPQLFESAPGVFALSPFLDRVWTLSMTDLWGEQPVRTEWILDLRAPSPSEVEVVYRNPRERFDRSAVLKRVRTAIDLASAMKYVRKKLRTAGAHTTTFIEGATVHSFERDLVLEGGPANAVMLEVAGVDRWILLSGVGVSVSKVSGVLQGVR